MSKKRNYNLGVEAGVKIAQSVIEQEVEAMSYIRLKIEQMHHGQEKMDEAVRKLVEDANENAINRLYGIFNEKVPADLEEHEQKLLLTIIGALSSNGANERQKRYYNNLRRHLNLAGFVPETESDYSKIENIESVASFRIIALAIRVFLFLEENSIETAYAYDENLFRFFVLRDKDYEDIDAKIELLYFLFGEDGLVELYGDYAEDLDSDLINTTKNEGKIPIDVIKKVYQFCEGSLWLDIAETNDFFAVRKNRPDRNLHIIEKKSGNEDIIHLERTPVEEYWAACFGLENSIFVQTGSSRAVYRIDITTKTIQRVYENKEAGELISVNAEGITLINAGESEWILRKISQQNEEIVRLPKCDWSRSYKIAIRNNRMYILAATASLEERFQTLDLLELGVYSIDLNKPEKYVPVKENIIGYNKDFFANIIKSSSKGWVFLGETDVKSYLEPTNNDKSFGLQYFSFEEETLTTLAYGCGYKSKQKRSLFSKESLRRMPNEFFIIGDTVCYRSGEKRFEAMVALDEPLAVKFM